MLLWGLSLLCGLLTTLASLFGILPIIYLPINYVLQVGMCSIFLAGYRGKNFNSDDLFKGFKDFWHCAGGMAWMYLWILIWALIPVAGIVMAIIKAYSYRFVPYILVEEKDISAAEALRKSMRMTQGYKGTMFAADIIVCVVYAVVAVLLSLLAHIPYLGIIFAIALLLLNIAFGVFGSLVFGLIEAAFYDEISAGANQQKYDEFNAQVDAQIKAHVDEIKQNIQPQKNDAE